MNEKHQELIRILEENRIVTGTSLGSYLNVSPRQIRNYVKYINELHDNLILSSNRGYSLNRDVAKETKILSNENNIENFSKTMRQDYITQIILSEKTNNIFDIAEECFVSVSTVESDLQTIKKKLNSFNLKITTSNYEVKIVGDEMDKRKIMNSILRDNNEFQFNFQNEIKMLIDYYNFDSLTVDIRKILKNHNIYANDYAVNSIVLHVVIMIDRFKYNKQLPKSNKMNKIKDTPAYEVAQDIANLIEKSHGMKINDNEFYQLVLVIDNNTSKIDYSIININNMNEYLSDAAIEMSDYLMSLIEDKFYIGNHDDQFIVRFAIHIHNLLNRTYVGHTIKNPYKNQLKNQNPFIYDIGVYLAYKIQQKYSVTISDDEIAFLAIHVGSQIQSTKDDSSKLKGVFVFSHYNHLHTTMYQELLRLFSNQISIESSITYDQYDKKQFSNFDIIFSTNNFIDDHRQIEVGHFMTDQVIAEVHEKISHALATKQSTQFKDIASTFFNEELFHYSDEKRFDKYEIIKWITKKTAAQGFTKSGFREEIVKREKLSHTNFKTVAIPHSLSSNVERSFIYTYISESPIQWGDSEINLILLVGINQRDIRTFSSLYDSLVALLNNPKNITLLLEAKDFTQFMEILFSLEEL